MALEHDTDGSGAAVLAALAKLAARWPTSWPGGLTVVGVTGSSGKTSTKDLLAAVLAPLGDGGRPARVVQQRTRPPVDGAARRRRTPTTWCWRCRPGAPAHIAALAEIAPPRIGGGAQRRHRPPRRVRLARGDRATPKANCRRRFRPSGGGGPQRRRRRGRGDGRARPRPAWSGVGGQPERRRVGRHGHARRAWPGPGSRCSRRRATDASRWPCTASTRSCNALVRGRGRAGVRREPATRWRRRWPRPARSRGTRMQVSTRDDGVTVINDAYNANPDSMRRGAARRWPAMARARAGGPRRSWAVLGEMAELGDGVGHRARRASAGSRCA